ncbi:hypothetical protein B9Q04_19875 [Candidatus Marsarchaeota G2 archaeon BE_D]|uniref:Uncharacterized protein n=1 Tax=Candidatus Marsarchaeota G2 archaeon BE_D TaxID=1978158 RepID=A0A2R6BYP2_9ARCH|nr:MAG: hypothetical protein B9Q04_19875 [Candidatus Marsarchaeota G2 archaeon BE_D]
MLSTFENDLYVVKDSASSVSLLYEYRLQGRVYYRAVRGRVYGWKKSVFLDLVNRLKAQREVRDYNTGSRLSVFIRVLPEINDVREAHKALDIVAEMGLEEAAFWVWKLNVHKKDAARAFKAMYRVK